eukprot:tig00000553_g2096.t1
MPPAVGDFAHVELSAHGAVLGQEEIRKALAEGIVRIEPSINPTAVGAASVDLTLGNEFRVFRRTSDPIAIRDDVDYKEFTDTVTLAEGMPFLLPPGQLCLGITAERVSLPSNMCGLLEGRSRFARMGIFIHVTAGFMQPGINNRQVLEIYNGSPNTVALYPGTKICQFIFLRLAGEAVYKGRFHEQTL